MHFETEEYSRSQVSVRIHSGWQKERRSTRKKKGPIPKTTKQAWMAYIR
jgi:hypothetical protein